MMVNMWPEGASSDSPPLRPKSPKDRKRIAQMTRNLFQVTVSNAKRQMKIESRQRPRGGVKPGAVESSSDSVFNEKEIQICLPEEKTSEINLHTYKNLKILDEFSQPLSLYNSEGLPLTDFKGNVLKSCFGLPLLTIASNHCIKEGLTQFIHLSQRRFTSSRMVQFNLPDGSPLILYHRDGSPLTDAEGFLLTDNYGSHLIQLTDDLRPVACYDGTPIFTQSGSIWEPTPNTYEVFLHNPHSAGLPVSNRHEKVIEEHLLAPQKPVEITCNNFEYVVRLFASPASLIIDHSFIFDHSTGMTRGNTLSEGTGFERIFCRIKNSASLVMQQLKLLKVPHTLKLCEEVFASVVQPLFCINFAQIAMKSKQKDDSESGSVSSTPSTSPLVHNTNLGEFFERVNQVRGTNKSLSSFLCNASHDIDLINQIESFNISEELPRIEKLIEERILSLSSLQINKVEQSEKPSRWCAVVTSLPRLKPMYPTLIFYHGTYFKVLVIQDSEEAMLDLYRYLAEIKATSYMN